MKNTRIKAKESILELILHLGLRLRECWNGFWMKRTKSKDFCIYRFDESNGVICSFIHWIGKNQFFFRSSQHCIALPHFFSVMLWHLSDFKFTQRIYIYIYVYGLFLWCPNCNILNCKMRIALNCVCSQV